MIEKNEIEYDLNFKDFAELFGTTVEDLPFESKQHINNSNFKYRNIVGEEREEIINEVIKIINSDSLSLVGPQRRDVWEKGWSENLKNFINNNYDAEELYPKYIRPDRPIRFKKEYIMPYDKNFELNFFKVYRFWLFNKYLKEYDVINEFGCGTGHNLVTLARMFPEKQLVGFDWAKSSVKLIEKIANNTGYNIESHHFDMFNPNEKIEIKKNSAVITMGALEQLGGNWKKFLEFIIEKAPSLFLHSEPICEFYDKNNFIDQLFIKYHNKRGYLDKYYTFLKKLESEEIIDIINTRRVFVGSMLQEGYSIIVWKLKKR